MGYLDCRNCIFKLKKDKVMSTTKYFKGWNDRVQPFAEAVEKNLDDVSALLAAHTGDPVDEKSATAALEVLSSKEAFSDEELIKALGSLNIPLGKLKLNLAKLRGVPVVVVEERATPNAYDAVLPSVPEDESFVASLKVGGELKVGKTEVLSAVKAGIANKLGLFGLPKIIKEKMEVFAEEQAEPVGAEYFKLQKLVVTRSYAEVLNAMGIEGSFMSDARQKAFLAKLEANLWGSLRGFNEMLSQWLEAYNAGAGSSANIAMLLMGQLGGGKAGLMPGMITPPETNGLHDEAEAVNESINKVFAGLGIPIAKALAYDATRIKEVLENPSLPAAVGAINRDQMLKQLDIAVGADYVRLERNITRFTLAIIEFPKITVPDEEYRYIAAMIQLGATIPWDKLDKGLSGIGSTGKARVKV